MTMMMMMCRVFGVTLDYDDDDHESDQTAADDDESLTENADNPSNLFSSATGQLIIPHVQPSCSHSWVFTACPHGSPCRALY